MNRASRVAGVSIIIGLAALACDPRATELATTDGAMTCEGCHTNQTLLKELAPPDTTVASGGG